MAPTAQPRKSRSIRAVIAAVALIGLIGGIAPIAGADEAHPKLDPAVRRALDDATDTSTIRVILTAQPGQFPALLARVRAKAIPAQHLFIGALSAQLRAQDVRAFESDPDGRPRVARPPGPVNGGPGPEPQSTATGSDHQPDADSHARPDEHRGHWKRRRGRSARFGASSKHDVAGICIHGLHFDHGRRRVR